MPQEIQRENLQGTGGYIKVGKKGNAQWNFSESFSWATPGFDINDIGYLKESDYKTNETEITFRKTDPWGSFRFAGINFIQRNTWNFGGKAVSNDVSLRWRSFSIKKRFEMDIKETFVWNSIDTRRLRGGPDLRYNSSLETAVVLNTDRAKPVMFKLEYYGKQYLGKQHTGYNSWHPSAIFRLGNHTRLTGQFNLGHNQDAVQYVATVPRLDAYSASDQNYIMGHMKQQTYGVTLNMQYNLTPDLLIQYYCSPFTSIAKFNEFKLAKNTLSSQFDSRFLVLGANDLTFSDGNYVFQNQNNTIKFTNPDFSFNELRSILVTRWEFLPGSSLYFVWEHNRSNRTGIYYSGWGNNLDHISHLPAANTLMIKANYWFSL